MISTISSIISVPVRVLYEMCIAVLSVSSACISVSKLFIICFVRFSYLFSMNLAVMLSRSCSGKICLSLCFCFSAGLVAIVIPFVVIFIAHVCSGVIVCPLPRFCLLVTVLRFPSVHTLQSIFIVMFFSAVIVVGSKKWLKAPFSVKGRLSILYWLSISNGMFSASLVLSWSNCVAMLGVMSLWYSFLPSIIIMSLWILSIVYVCFGFIVRCLATAQNFIVEQVGPL